MIKKEYRYLVKTNSEKKASEQVMDCLKIYADLGEKKERIYKNNLKIK